MPFVEIKKTNKRSVAVTVSDDEGEPLANLVVDRYKPRDVLRFANILHTSQPETLAALNRICETEGDSVSEVLQADIPTGLIQSIVNGAPIPNGIPDPTANPQHTPSDTGYTIYVREITQLKQHGRRYTADTAADALRAALVEPYKESTCREPLIEWADTDRLCVLDIDYHTLPIDQRPTPDELRTILDRIKPLPLVFHTSHGRGAKLYYASAPGYTAAELASIAGIAWVSADPRATFDVMRSTRHPGFVRQRDESPAPCPYPEAIEWVYGAADVAPIRRVLMGEVSFDDVSSYLESRGWYFGATRPHSECPIDPTNDHKENVFIGEQGVYCHRCAARGLGSKTQAGFVSYGTLVGVTDTRVATMVRNFVHLEHAAIVLQNVWPNVPQRILADAYRVMLKIVHQPEDPRIALAMLAGKGWIRSNGMWVSLDGSESLTQGQMQFVNSLPATRFVIRSGEKAGSLGADTARVVAFMNRGSLAEFGYDDVTFVRGMQIYGVHLPYRDCQNIRVVIRNEFRNCEPKYVPHTRRMPIQEAWRYLENEFPGINRNYVRLLIASKGASEGRLAQCPYLLVAGVSSAGKSTTVQIAAGLCGDRASEPIFVPQVDRFRQSLMDAARQSSFVVVNEVFKMAERSRLSYTQALDPMLSLTEDSRSHVLYVGSVAFGRLPVFVLTDIDIPPEVEADMQLARRFVMYRLPSANNWQKNLVAKNFQPHEFRRLSYDHNDAANAIVSDVVDEFFRSPMPLVDIAAALQCGTLDTYSGERMRNESALRSFFALVCNGPPAIGAAARRYSPADGWVMIDRAHASELTAAWEEIADGREPHLWCRSRAAGSVDWSKVLQVPPEVGPIVCEIKAAKSLSCVYVRFRSTDEKKRPRWINGKTFAN